VEPVMTIYRNKNVFIDCDKEENLALHLDGARLWNAMLATSTSPKFYGEQFDTISICFSKGLGAPIGSALLGSEEQPCKKPFGLGKCLVVECVRRDI
jgi:threonine aldolase